MKKIILLSLVATFVTIGNINAKQPAAKAEIKTEQTATAQNELKGIIFDKKTNETLAGAAITANGQKIYTDLDGNFTIQNVCSGNCTIKISMISYQDQTIEVNTNDAGLLKIKLNQR